MRHGKKVNHLGRKTAHRSAMLANMASSIIEHKRINTTLAKAKAVKQFLEPLVTKSKVDSTHNRRLVFSKLRQKEAVTELFRTVAVDFNEIYTPGKAVAKKSTRRGRSKKAAAPAAETKATKEEE